MIMYISEYSYTMYQGSHTVYQTSHIKGDLIHSPRF